MVTRKQKRPKDEKGKAGKNEKVAKHHDGYGLETKVKDTDGSKGIVWG